MDKNKFNNIDDENEQDEILDNKNPDDLFDFKPIGTVDSSEERKKTKKEELKSILEENFLEDFQDVNVMDLKSEEEVLFEEEQDSSPSKNIQSLDIQKIKSIIESTLYVCGNEGASLNDLKKITEASSSDIRKIIKEMTNDFSNDKSRGLTIQMYGEKYKLLSKPENREDISKLITLKYRNPLSNKVMETLAIIAYNQPCTKSIIQDIRGKDPTVTIQKLIDLELIIEAGRSEGPGRPFLYTVTHKFYNIFGIKNISDLPAINLDQPFHDEEISFFDTNRFND
ncbi:MAG: SMC-Scp complex subunit ScpB [Mycoplasma sp.]